MNADAYTQRAALIRRIDPAWKLPRNWTTEYLASLADHQDNMAAECRKTEGQG